MGMFWDKVMAMRENGRTMKKAEPQKGTVAAKTAVKKPEKETVNKKPVEKEKPVVEPTKSTERADNFNDKGTSRKS